MDSEPCRPSRPGGIRGIGGPGRAGTAAAEERLLGWTGGEGEEGGVQTVTGDVERGEEGGREHEPETRAEAGRAELVAVRPLFDSGCWRSGIGERDGSGRRRERGRDVGLGRGEEAGPAGRGGKDG